MVEGLKHGMEMTIRKDGSYRLSSYKKGREQMPAMEFSAEENITCFDSSIDYDGLVKDGKEVRYHESNG